MIVLKHHHARRTLIILGSSLVTTLILIAGTIAIHNQELAPLLNTVHAAVTSVATTCATTRGTQQALCEHKDPIAQGCVIDAESLDLQTVFQDTQQTKPLGDVELRYSPSCKTYWVRTTAFVTRMGVLKAIHAVILFHNHTTEDITGTPKFAGTPFAYAAWTDMTTMPSSPHAGSGSFDLIGQSRSLTAFVQAHNK
ncbi:DUF2690 domain-containing protein [Dictyobacter formicarum]|uniref:DUF2690 domain-containing protein n=1 Tax=Dictyobacter formicarum TaxID=2778368 RepID=A0ABQ3V9J6_9CHLR|nr:DUF2690 domain-containing protein [Dictyobacter formicarum]GHO82343.1 hypothetical protein KSZ_03490 [Dictyobacter formicarum]